MKSKISVVFGLLLIAAMAITACAPAAPVEEAAEEAAPVEEAAEEAAPLRVVHLVNGVLGDKSFFDSAERGVKRASEELGIEYKTIEAGIDPAKWEAALEDAAANEIYDIMIVGTWQMAEFLERVAPKYPDKFFIIYDVSVNYETCEGGCANVYSVTYKQNEGSYLAGIFAGSMTETGIVGAVGGQDIGVINDFIVGFEQGVKEIDPTHTVIIQYAGSWNDPARGKELALAMYHQGADYVFQIAGGTGVGVFQAAQEVGKFAIGVDSDQALIIEATDPEQAAFIPTSMMKNVDNSLFRALQMHLEGTLPYGQAEALGVAEGGVGLAYNKFFEAHTPQSVQDRVEQAKQDLLEGRIVVDSAF